MKLTYSQFLTLLESLKGTAIVGLLTLTDARLLKTGNPLALPVMKLSRLVAFVGANYERAVNREAVRQEATPEFTSAGLPSYLEWFLPGKVLRHVTKGTLYLRIQSTPRQRGKQPVRLLGYRDASGRYVSRESVRPFLPVKRESTKQQLTAGLNQTVWVNNYAFDSILKVRIAGRTYNLASN